MKIDTEPTEFKKRFPYLDDCNADHRLIGYPGVLNPFVQYVSGSRLDMFASHRKQSLIIKGAQLPQIISGYEMEDGKYTFNDTRREEDVVVEALIPRYESVPGMKSEHNPWVTVIYKGCQSKAYGYFNIPQYHLVTDGFGFRYKKHTAIQVGKFIPQEEVIACSSAIEGNQYQYGVNLNTCYMTVQENIEDSMWISDRAAEALESEEYRKLIIDIKRDTRPLSHNPVGEEIKIFPDIGECVGENGLLCAFRPTNYVTCGSDMDKESLSSVHRLTDIVRIIKPGSQILNLEFLVKGNPFSNPNYAQIAHYHNATIRYWKEIVNFYFNVIKNGKLTREFNTLITEGIQWLVAHGVKVSQFNDGGSKKTEIQGYQNSSPVEFIQVAVTYRKKREVALGFKITDRHGGKGIIAKITPLEQMPRDEYGNYADLVIDPNSVCARNNPAQFWEQGINHISEIVKRRVVAEAEKDVEKAFKTLIEYLNDIRPNYAKLVEDTHPTLADKKSLLNWIKENFIVIHIPPFYNDLTLEKIQEIGKKWNALPTHLTWVTRDENDQLRPVVSKEKTIIGSKYVLCLEKIPHSHAPGMAYVSHYGSPSQPPSAEKNSLPVVCKPVKFGEDEVRLTQAMVGPKTMKRYLGLLGTSQKGAEAVIETLLKHPHPTNIHEIPLTNEQLLETDTMCLAFHHITGILGIDTRNTQVSEEDMKWMAEGALEFIDEGEDDDEDK